MNCPCDCACSDSDTVFWYWRECSECFGVEIFGDAQQQLEQKHEHNARCPGKLEDLHIHNHRPISDVLKENKKLRVALYEAYDFLQRIDDCIVNAKVRYSIMKTWRLDYICGDEIRSRGLRTTKKLIDALGLKRGKMNGHTIIPFLEELRKTKS